MGFFCPLKMKPSLQRHTLKSPSLHDLNSLRKGTGLGLPKNPFHMQVRDYQNFAKRFHEKDKTKLLIRRSSATEEGLRPLTQISTRLLPSVKQSEKQIPKPMPPRQSPNEPILSPIIRSSKISKRSALRPIELASARRLKADDLLQSFNAKKQRSPNQNSNCIKNEDDEGSLFTNRTQLEIEDYSSDESLQDLLEALGGKASKAGG